MTGVEEKETPAVFDRDSYIPCLSAQRGAQIFVVDLHAHSPTRFEYTGR